MGAGSSQEAEYTLVADIPAGTWRLVADCFVLESVDMQFEIFQRKAAGGDVPIVRWDHHFDPSGSPTVVQVYEVIAAGPRVVVATGDQLIFRYTGTNSTQPTSWFPDGEGANYGGRIPYVDLPH